MVRFFKEIYVVAIGYKSGITRTTECEDFSVSRGPDSELNKVEWTKIQPGSPEPLYIHPSAIESVWVLRTRRVFAPSLRK